MKPTSLSGNSPIIAGNAIGTTDRFALYHSAGALSAAIGSTLYNSTLNLVVGTWSHAVLTFDGSRITIYLNGGNAQSSTITFSGTYTTGLAVSSLYGGGQYFTGSLDDVRIYNRALSAGEVNKLWQMGR